MKKELSVYFLLPLLLAGCVTVNNPVADTSSVDKALQKTKTGDAVLTNDITSQKTQDTEDTITKDIDLQSEELALRQEEQDNSPVDPTQKDTTMTDTLSSVDELQVQDLALGNGDEAVDGKQVTVHYTGKLTNGQKFDSSLDRGQPFTFMLGSGQVIQGWDMGVKGMKVGGKRKLTIPAKFAYGDRGVPGAIPPGATLVFDVELLAVK